jgi:hypothetical protein
MNSGIWNVATNVYGSALMGLLLLRAALVASTHVRFFNMLKAVILAWLFKK